ELMACEAVNKKLAAHIGKYDGLFARLCLIWHCIEHADRNLIDQIDENTARRVERFLHCFLLPHATASLSLSSFSSLSLSLSLSLVFHPSLPVFRSFFAAKSQGTIVTVTPRKSS